MHVQDGGRIIFEHWIVPKSKILSSLCPPQTYLSALYIASLLRSIYKIKQTVGLWLVRSVFLQSSPLPTKPARPSNRETWSQSLKRSVPVGNPQLFVPTIQSFPTIRSSFMRKRTLWWVSRFERDGIHESINVSANTPRYHSSYIIASASPGPPPRTAKIQLFANSNRQAAALSLGSRLC